MQGVALFRKRPADLFIFGNTYLFVILFVGILIPFLGAALVTLLTPAMAYGINLAGKMANSGLRITPATLFAGLGPDNRRYLNKLMMLGVAYTAGFAVAKLIAHLVMGPQPDIDLANLRNLPPEQLAQVTEFMMQSAALTILTTIPVILAFWYAPVLVVWHDMQPGQAIFSSWVAVWRNKGAFVIYGMGWLLLSSMLSGLIVGVFSLLGLPAALLGALNIMTLALIMAISLATVYFSYTAVFEHSFEAERTEI